MSATAVGASVVLFVSLLSLLFHTGVFSLGGSSSPGASARHPSLTPTPTRTPTPVSGWLQVAPTSVHLGCNDPQKTQFVVLVNSGPQSVSWQANLPLPEDQAGVEVSPHAGELASGASAVIQLQLHDHAAGQQGVIQFDPNNPEAGPSPRLSYTTENCD